MGLGFYVRKFGKNYKNPLKDYFTPYLVIDTLTSKCFQSAKSALLVRALI
jgi:hypothetical protein